MLKELDGWFKYAHNIKCSVNQWNPFLFKYLKETHLDLHQNAP